MNCMTFPPNRDVDLLKIVCLQNKVRWTSHPITTKHFLLMSWNISNLFIFKSNTQSVISQEWLVWLTWNEKEVHHWSDRCDMRRRPMNMILGRQYDIGLLPQLQIWILNFNFQILTVKVNLWYRRNIKGTCEKHAWEQATALRAS